MKPPPTVTDVTISDAALGDAGEILELQHLAYRSEALLTNDFDIPPLLQDRNGIEAEFATHRILKATIPGRIVGSVRARETAGPTCEIGRLIVHPDVENRGLGKRLMAAIELAFAHVARFELFTGEKSARNLYLYQKLGYRIFRTERLNERTTLVFLQKPNRGAD